MIQWFSNEKLGEMKHGYTLGSYVSILPSFSYTKYDSLYVAQVPVGHTSSYYFIISRENVEAIH